MPLYDDKYYEQYRRRAICLPIASGQKPWYYYGWKKILKRYNTDKNPIILEIGCGLGMGAHQWMSIGKTILLDISADAIMEAKSKGRGHEWLIGDAENLIFPDNFISIVIALDVLEHLQEPEKCFSEVYRVLKPNALFVFTTPNPESFGAKRKGKLWFGFKDHTHINIRCFHEWENLLSQNNFEIILRGSSTLWDLPYWQSFSLLVQKIIFIPINILIELFYGPVLPWRLGENSIFIVKKKE